MKILHLGKYYPPYFGGIEKVNFDLVEGLNEGGLQTDVLCFNHSKEKIVSDKKYMIHRTRTNLELFSTPLSFNYFWKLRKIANEYDILHIHAPNPLATLALLVSGFKGKIVVHWHSDIVKQKKLKFFFNPLQKRMLRKAHRIIATSEPYLNYSEDLRPFRDKCVVIPIGINPAEFRENKDFRSKLNDTYKGKKVVFSLGRLIYYKGFDTLIESATMFDENTLLLIGGKGELETSLKQKVEALKLQDKIHFLGSIPIDEIGEYYRRADIFCLASHERSEAFGVVLIEAMSFGCPIVCCQIAGSGVPWVAQNQYNADIVETNNPHALADAINKLIATPEKLSLYRFNSINRFQELFSLDHMVERVTLLYDSIK